MYTQKKKPSALNYVFAVGLMVAGLFAFIIFLFTRLSDLGDQPTYIVPGTHKLELTETGTYTIFHEYKSVVGGKYYTSPKEALNSFNIIITSKDDDTIQVVPTTGKSSYSSGSRMAEGVFTFSIDKSGTYSLEAVASHEDTKETVLTISNNFMGKLMGTIFGGMAILFGCGAIGVFIIVLTIIKQVAYNKEQREMEQKDGSF